MARRDWDEVNRRARANRSRAIRHERQRPSKPINPNNVPASFRTIKLKWPARCEICGERIEGGERARMVSKPDQRTGYMHEHHGV